MWLVTRMAGQGLIGAPRSCSAVAAAATASAVTITFAITPSPSCRNYDGLR